MIKYSELNYTTPPRYQWQVIECSYAVTPDEIVRRTTDHATNKTTYETADLYKLIGEFAPQNRVPSVARDAWTLVEGDELTPAVT